MTTIHYEKEINVKASYDVIVAGSGPAGICAAVAAARNGSHVALVERYGVVGGNLTAGYVGPVLGMVGKGTMRDELVNLLGIPENDMIGARRARLTISNAQNLFLQNSWTVKISMSIFRAQSMM